MYKQCHYVGRFAPKDETTSQKVPETNIPVGSRCEVESTEPGSSKRRRYDSWDRPSLTQETGYGLVSNTMNRLGSLIWKIRRYERGDMIISALEANDTSLDGHTMAYSLTPSRCCHPYRPYALVSSAFELYAHPSLS
ncbi:hypothetical protein PM082_023659 [Marasmius tenuissimus]|nr:hypothetical protein PM082_023659 [Marasmius tenuissimus]